MAKNLALIFLSLFIWVTSLSAEVQFGRTPPLGGSTASYGENSRAGMELAAEEGTAGVDSGNAVPPDPNPQAHHHHMLAPMYGQYAHTREASGTAWQPDVTPMEGWHFSAGDWTFMAHGAVNGIYDDQGGKRGDEKLFSSSMGMLMGTRPLGVGTFGFRSMLSLDALMGKRGYPELLQTGETADGEEHLIDRQHPHDLFMELALTYSVPVTDESSVFLYAGLPGEPAIGPAAFMHRASSADIPDAPITHHWLDSTHITEGVVTTGYVYRNMKIEGSAFNAREPDQYRYDIETRSLDSWATRFTYNPTENWSMQVSYADLSSPEALTPEVDVRRTTASVTYNLPFDRNNWAVTAAWGRNRNRGADSSDDMLDAYLLESELVLHDTHTFFGRFENVEKDELFDDESPQAGQAYRVNRIGMGYIYDFPKIDHLKFGVGGEAAWHLLPSALDEAYGDTPFSFLLFVRAKIV
jgi:hypothetical protein